MTAHHDVIVAGGGSAGVAAAVTAAREGASTLLIERFPQLGGIGSNAQVHTLCGLFHPDLSKPPRWLNPGLPAEIGRQMLEQTGQTEPDVMGRVRVLRHRPEALAKLMLDLCRAEPLLTLALGADATALNRRGGNRWEVAIGAEARTAGAVIDATGDALLARLLGGDAWEMAAGGRLYRPAYVCRFGGVRGRLTSDEILQAAAAMVRAVRDGSLDPAALGATLRQSPDQDEVFVSIDLEAAGAKWDPLDPKCVDAVTGAGRQAAEAVWQFLRDSLPFFAQATALQHPVHLGVRESARWKGDTVLTADDLLRCRRFPDEVALAGWPLEMRETARGPRFRYFDRPEPAGIPAGCLRSRCAPGVFFAGRCLSCDHEALASVRVIGTCLATGQAAGRLAAEFVRGGGR